MKSPINLAIVLKPAASANPQAKGSSTSSTGGGGGGPSNPIVDLASYPILTEEVGYPPSPLARQAGSGMSGGGLGSAGSSLSQIVNKAVSDVLGWKAKAGDAKGFMGALTQSFAVTEVNGHVESKWTPRTYAVQTDVGGGITGAQASVYSRAKVALDQSLPFLDGLYSLNPEATPEDVAALKAVVKSQFTEMVNEIGYVGGPRIARVNQYFSLLLGEAVYPINGTALNQTDPDQIQGTLGNLRDYLGLNFETQAIYSVNTVDDETNLSNYRIIADYVTSLAQTWLNNVSYLELNTKTPFFGTQLVLLSRQLSVVAESVDEVRFTLDSVFVGPAERQTIELSFTNYPNIFLEDLLLWIQNFTTEEGPRLIQDGGKFGVKNTFTRVARQLEEMVKALPTTTVKPPPPPGFYSPRVQLSIRDLRDQLGQLMKLAQPIDAVISPQAQVGPAVPAITSITPTSAVTGHAVRLYVFGTGFLSSGNLKVQLWTKNTGPYSFPAYLTSEGLVYAYIGAPSLVPPGVYDVTVVNGDSNKLNTLRGAFTVT